MTAPDRTDTRTKGATALVPAAGRVPESVLALSNVTSPAMIPVAGRPVIQWTLTYLESLGVATARIAVPQRGLFVEEFVECVFGDRLQIEFVAPSQDRGLGFTVAELADSVSGPTLVVLGDTHFQFADPAALGSEPTVLVSDVEESYRWCVAELSSDGRVKALRDKEPGLHPPLKALIGVYWFPEGRLLDEAAAAAVAASEGRVEMASILERVGAETPIRAVEAGSWLDCGNPDRQAESQRVLLEQRAFNELSVDSVFGTLTKRSRQVEKFIDEINYLELLPPHLAVLFPRVLERSVDPDDAFLTMEFYGYPTLAELFVFENVDPGIWHRVFQHLHHIVRDGFMAFDRPLDPDAVQAMLLGKALDRIESIDPASDIGRLVRDPGTVVLNGVELPGLLAARPRLEAEVDRLAATAQGAVIHGDLCFSNILYDLRSGICKLLDPRGSFGEPGIYGDPRYDVAKLVHSVHGLYDFVMADLFRLESDGTDFELDIRSRPYHDDIADEFETVFYADFERRDILLVCGLIFVGLPALHYDHPDRQTALYLRGLQLLDEALRDEAG